jgi:hypothetical protein
VEKILSIWKKYCTSVIVKSELHKKILQSEVYFSENKVESAKTATWK